MTLLKRFLIGYAFDQLYTRFAWGYDGAAWLASAGYWYRWVAAVLPFVQDGPVLEVGSGRGRLLPRLRTAGWQSVGLDASAQMVRYAHHLHPDIVRAVGDALPFPDHHFGTIITTFPAPYVRSPLWQREAMRVLREGGAWLWLDNAQLRPTLPTLVSTLLARAVAPADPQRAIRAMIGDAWHCTVHRVNVGHSTVDIYELRRGAVDPRS
ncbi:MAG: class I SAM-dependent methyltransferase [Anaerolineales bacterium]|nr:class I SAM-dependent methyltransferase [Anaerolineales bacterium]